ncbi:DUF6525 family protein [uncultured Roseobacter sp.]|uniref:DUF6525 family protein n=1 Tax=uncultured Roseobacter sp. TaxID=114847 RepID=UPI0034520656
MLRVSSNSTSCERVPIVYVIISMSSQHTRNLGQTSLHSKRRTGDPMQTYDALPKPLRRWLSQAVLPWSPASVRKIWTQAQAKGLGADDALARLCRAEAKMLARDQHAIRQPTPSTE